MPYYAPVSMTGLTRYTTIEETATLQQDTPMEDFAYHFYKTRYDRLKGILQRDFDTLRKSALECILDSMNRNVVALPKLRLANKMPMAWSMNWFRLRDDKNKMFVLSKEQKEQIIDDFHVLRQSYPFLAEMYIFQGEDKDMLLVAMSLMMED